MDLPQNSDLAQILAEQKWRFDDLPNVRDTADWSLIKGLTPQQLVRLKNIRFTPPTGVSDPLVEFLKTRLSYVTESPKVVELSPLGGMSDQDEKLFGKKLYGFEEVAKTVATLAGNTFASFSKKQPPNKTTYKMGTILGGQGTGKSSFLDHHVSLILEYGENEELKERLRPESYPLVLNITFNNRTVYSAGERSADSGAISIARRLAQAYTQASWDEVLRKTVPGDGLNEVLRVIVDHHKKVNRIEEKEIVVVINVDELNQIHAQFAGDKTASDYRLREMVVALRSLSMTGVYDDVGVGPAIICLMAGTAMADFCRAMKGFEFVAPRLPLLNGSEIVNVMRDCKVDEQYFCDPSFQLLLEDTGGVPRVLRMVLEGLTVQYSEKSIEIARNNALAYLQKSSGYISDEEKLALIPHVVLGYPADASGPLLRGSSNSNALTFEDVQTFGTVFVEDGRLTMPILHLEAFAGVRNVDVQNLIASYRRRTWAGFEEFCALFHSYMMRHLASDSTNRSEVSLGKFYQVTMAPELAELSLALNKEANYKVIKSATRDRSHRFPGLPKPGMSEAKKKELEDKNKFIFDQLMSGAIVLNATGVPACDCVMVNKSSSRLVVRSLCMSHTIRDTKLTQDKIEKDHKRAKDRFKRYQPLSDATVVTVHISNRELRDGVTDRLRELYKGGGHTPKSQNRRKTDLPTDCIVIGREDIPKFFGPTFQRGLLSPLYARSTFSADSPREYCTLSIASSRSVKSLVRGPRVTQAGVTGLRLARYIARSLF